MTRQGGRLALAVGLGAFLASGCTPSWAERCPGPDPLRAPAPGAKAAAVPGPDDGGSSYNPQPRGHRQEELHEPDITKVIHYPEGDKAPEAPAAATTPPAEHATGPGLELDPKAEQPENADKPEKPQKPEEPLVAALRCFLEKRPDEAPEHLKDYDKANQEMLKALLPLAVRLTEGSLDGAQPQEMAALADQLHGLSLPLRRRATLRIAKMCFCREIQRFGRYEPLSSDE